MQIKCYRMLSDANIQNYIWQNSIFLLCADNNILLTSNYSADYANVLQQTRQDVECPYLINIHHDRTEYWRYVYHRHLVISFKFDNSDTPQTLHDTRASTHDRSWLAAENLIDKKVFGQCKPLPMLLTSCPHLRFTVHHL